MTSIARIGSGTARRANHHSRVLGRVLGPIIAVLLTANVWAFLEVGNRVTPLTVDAVVERYRAMTSTSPDLAESTASGSPVASTATDDPAPVGRSAPAQHQVGGASAPDPAEASSQRPPTGVYLYATSGFEDISIAGGHHTYPDRTTMTVMPASCGVDVRWDVFEERWDRWTLCTPGHALELRSFETYHEFFGQVEHRSYECVPGTDFRPQSSTPGTRTSGRCESRGAVVELTATVVSIEDVIVGSTNVAAVHVRVDETLTGDTRGTRFSDSWYAVADGLLLRRTAETDVHTESVFGSTHFTEELRLDLTSLEPRS